MDNLDNLAKTNGTHEEVKPSKGSAKFAHTKRKVKEICKELSYPADEFDEKKTLELIDEVLDPSNNIGRILYSEVSSHIFSINESERASFASNIEKLLLTSLNSENTENAKTRNKQKFIIKLFDHSQLAQYQIDNTDNQHKRSINKTKEELQKEIKGIEKEYISILGIFSSVVLAFVGGLTFSTSVLDNISNVSIYRLITVALIIGFVFINMIWTLLNFIWRINGKKGKLVIPIFANAAIILGIAITVIIKFLSK